jgi:hypothetical protein
LDAVQCPKVADMLERRRAFLWAGRRSGVRQVRHRSADSGSNRDGSLGARCREGSSRRTARGTAARSNRCARSGSLI